jgi:MFS transporter, DHA2 family, multidrug resistance protein
MQNASSEDAGLRAGRREWIGLAVLTLPALLTAFDIGALFLALPHLSADLGTSTVEQLWISDIYGFMIAGFLITMGTLGDRIGRRKLLFIGAAIFGVLSVVAAYSQTPETLIVARALLGIAGATLMPSTLALITNMFRDEHQRGMAIGILYSCLMVGSALGPVIGGLLLARFWWGSVFLLGVPIMALLLVAGPFLLPEYRNPSPGRIDLLSVVLSLAAILPIIYGIKQLALYGTSSPGLAIAALALGLIIGYVFVRRQRRLADPLLDLRLFAKRSFTAVIIALLAAAIGMAGNFLLVSQYVQTVRGYSPPAAGLLLAPTGLAVAAGSLLAPIVAKRVNTRAVITIGLACSAVGFILITQARSTSGLIEVVLGLVIVHFFVGPLLALGTGIVVGSAPPERAGSAASISETSNYLGTTLGIALLGTVAAVVYRHQIADHVPQGVPAGDAVTARQTVAGASEVAGHLPAPTGNQLLHAAGDAFTAGLNVAGGVGVVIFAGLVALALWGLRDRGEAQKEVAAPEDIRVPEPSE